MQNIGQRGGGVSEREMGDINTQTRTIFLMCMKV